MPEEIIIKPSHPEIFKFCQKINEFTIQYHLEHNSNDLCLQLWLARERNNISKSKFQNFIAFLPLNLNNFPILYSPKYTKIIKHTFLSEMVQTERTYLETDYKLFQSKDPKILDKISQQDFNEAYEIFYSRSYQYLNDNNEKITGLIPLADLFNYKVSDSSRVGWRFNQSTHHFIVYAKENIKRGNKVKTINNLQTNQLLKQLKQFLVFLLCSLLNSF